MYTGEQLEILEEERWSVNDVIGVLCPGEPSHSRSAAISSGISFGHILFIEV
jgi:hypothetical protein